MTVPVEHQAFLRQSDFVPACLNDFSADERAILTRFGRWMEALASGQITPATPEQQHFVRAARGEAVPDTQFEQIWVKVSRNRNTDSVAKGGPRVRSPGEQDVPGTLQGKLNLLAVARRNLDALRELVEAKRQEVLKTVEADLAEIEAQYADQLEEESRIVAEKEAQVKAAVLQAGHSVRAEGVEVIYYRPRITWDSKGLARYAETNPEVEQFRKVGQPSASLRYKT